MKLPKLPKTEENWGCENVATRDKMVKILEGSGQTDYSLHGCRVKDRTGFRTCPKSCRGEQNIGSVPRRTTGGRERRTQNRPHSRVHDVAEISTTSWTRNVHHAVSGAFSQRNALCIARYMSVPHPHERSILTPINERFSATHSSVHGCVERRVACHKNERSRHKQKTISHGGALTCFAEKSHKYNKKLSFFRCKSAPIFTNK